ncbi:MAG TPA: complex I NDUFA9 subunit family protein [Gemmatimonadales bacterium]|nr:complex I NDUFA9 subunit family protein [Gemmatimonadales bacterium]
MLIAVTGATGFVGRHVAATLVRRGHTVRLLVRDPRRAAVLQPLPAQTVTGDLADSAALTALVRGADAVVHLVGIIVEVGCATFEAVHVEGTRRLLTAARDGGTTRWVQMSAVGARVDATATPYHRTKWLAEELVRASGIGHAIFRPSIISGPESAPIRTLARLHRWSLAVPVFGDGRFPTQPVWIEDVALAFARAVENPATSGAFELGGPVPLSYEEFVRAIGRAAGHPRPLVHLPLVVARAGARVFDVLGRAAPLTSDQLQMLIEGSATPANAIESVFGIRPLPFEEGLRRYLGGRASR